MTLSSGTSSIPFPQPFARIGFNEHPLAWLAFCVALLTLLRLGALALARTDLFFDEAQYWFWSRELAFGYYSKPPLIAWIIRGATDICGMGEACIRAPSPIIHGATALLVYGIGRALYDARIGFWSGLVYATLPGVSFSSGMISTDVPLLFCTALALLALIKMRASPSWGWALVLGLAIGLGLNAKYAMVYFLLGLLVYGLAVREGRALLRDVRLYAALAIAGALIAPNMVWNAQHRFATLAHTADNASWGGSLFNPGNALDFFAGQFGVFGPILFAGLIAFCLRWRRDAAPTGNREAERLLLSFSLPVIALMLVQALLSRALANWAAFSYVAATVLITAALLRQDWRKLFRTSLTLHAGTLLLLGVGGVLAGRFALPGGADPNGRMLGWRELAEATNAKAEAGGFRAIATDRRSMAAELFYYLRDGDIPIVALRDGPPRDHFELTRPLTADTPRPVLLVSLNAAPRADAEPIGNVQIPAGSKHRSVSFFALRDAKP